MARGLGILSSRLTLNSAGTSETEGILYVPGPVVKVVPR